jgi:hypothetical protein
LVFPGTTTTLVLSREQLRPEALTATDSVTDPLNPYKPATIKPAVPTPPGVIMTDPASAGGFTVIAKSGLGTVRWIVL